LTTPSAWPPEREVPMDELFAIEADSVKDLARGWSTFASENLHRAARLRAYRGESSAITPLLALIPEGYSRVLAEADAATILARRGDLATANALLARAEAEEPGVRSEWNAGFLGASLGAALVAAGRPERASEPYFERALASLQRETNAGQNYFDLARAFVSCGLMERARALITSPSASSSSTFYTRPFAALLLRLGLDELLDAWLTSLSSPLDWSFANDLAQAIAAAGRPDLLDRYAKRMENYASDELRALAEANRGIAPPRTRITEQTRAELRRRYDEVLATPRTRRQYPMKNLAEWAAANGHFAAAVSLLRELSSNDGNARPQSAFTVLWIAATGSPVEPW
jgi:hypothetical protein